MRTPPESQGPQPPLYLVPTDYATHSVNRKLASRLCQQVRKNDWAVEDVIYTVALCQLREAGLLEKPHVAAVMRSAHCHAIDALLNGAMPKELVRGERDWLGLIYQGLLPMEERTDRGVFYTRPETVAFMTSGLDFGKRQTLLDPCCGSGAFLIGLDAHPDQLYGVDSDPVAVFMARVNLLLRYPQHTFTPHIFHGRFLDMPHPQTCGQPYPRFDYVVGAPPWTLGSDKRVGLFQMFRRSFRAVKPGGELRILLPDTVLSVKAYAPLRRYILEEGNLTALYRCEQHFTRAAQPCVALRVARDHEQGPLLFIDHERRFEVDKSGIAPMQTSLFSFLPPLAASIVARTNEVGRLSLRGSQFAVGIVPGSEGQHLITDHAEAGTEPLITGPDIELYRLTSPARHIHFVRDELRQVAKDEMYRAPEKLVYRFVAKHPVVAYDNTGSLTLNSANILIPKVEGMSIKTVMAILNSEVVRYCFHKVFHTSKMLKSHLTQVPLPRLTEEEDRHISAQVDLILAGDDRPHYELQQTICRLYGLGEAQQAEIERWMNRHKRPSGGTRGHADKAETEPDT